jgi:PST family polysaccharide transporter
MAPEFIGVVLGPAWDSVVLPFRMFTISLLFRMSSKISDACTKAAGEVYQRAVIQWVFGFLVIGGAIVGQHWGVGGVAVAVSIAMGINWLGMARLGRTVTGLSWPRFIAAHGPAAFLAGLIGVFAAAAAHFARGADLGSLVTLIAAGVAAASGAMAVLVLRPALFLGQHGLWAYRTGLELLRGRTRKLSSSPDERAKLAPLDNVGSK